MWFVSVYRVQRIAKSDEGLYKYTENKDSIENLRDLGEIVSTKFNKCLLYVKAMDELLNLYDVFYEKVFYKKNFLE